MLDIRKAESRDAGAIPAIILPTIREGATYALDPEMSEAEALAYWMAPENETFVAEEDGVILGTYFMRPNQGGGGRQWLPGLALPDPASSTRPPCGGPVPYMHSDGDAARYESR